MDDKGSLFYPIVFVGNFFLLKDLQYLLIGGRFIRIFKKTLGIEYLRSIL